MKVAHAWFPCVVADGRLGSLGGINSSEGRKWVMIWSGFMNSYSSMSYWLKYQLTHLFFSISVCVEAYFEWKWAILFKVLELDWNTGVIQTYLNKAQGNLKLVL